LDDTALEGIQAAFVAAPSTELATVIVTALTARGDASATEPYVSLLDASLDGDLFFTLSHAYLTDQKKNALSALLDATRHPDTIKLVEALFREGKKEHAQLVYNTMCMIDKSFKSERLESLSCDSVQNTVAVEKARLRVVDKLDLAQVTDLSRYVQGTTTFGDVVGLDEVKKQIHKKIILPFQKPSLFQRFKKKIGGGVMLFGPPGCGKTLLARATAGECRAAFFNIEISDVLDMYIGESEQKLHAIFEKARDQTPSVLFFDEIEALAGKREYARNNPTSNVVSQFLTELDGFSQNNAGVLVLASTNVPWAIDPAFLRPGRFDRMLFVPPPDRTARESILKHHMRGRPAKNNIDYSAITAKTRAYSGADLANLVEMAADEAIDDSITYSQDTAIEAKHFSLALQHTRSTTTEWLTTARNYARYSNDGGRYNDVLEFLKKHGK